MRGPYEASSRARPIYYGILSNRLGWLGKVRLSWFYKKSTAIKLIHYPIDC